MEDRSSYDYEWLNLIAKIKYKKTTEIPLTDRKITDDQLLQLKGVAKDNTQINAIYLSGNRNEKLAVTIIEILKHNPFVRKLYLANCHIDDTNMKQLLLYLIDHRLVEELAIGGNLISIESISLLGSVLKINRLRTLSISGTPLTSSHITTLADSGFLSNRSLKTLDLSWCSLDLQSIEGFYKLFSTSNTSFYQLSHLSEKMGEISYVSPITKAKELIELQHSLDEKNKKIERQNQLAIEYDQLLDEEKNLTTLGGPISNISFLIKLVENHAKQRDVSNEIKMLSESNQTNNSITTKIDIDKSVTSNDLFEPPPITAVNLQGNSLDDKCLECLKDTLFFKLRLTSIDLSCNLIGDSSIGHLQNIMRYNKSIKVLNFSYNKLTSLSIKPLLNILDARQDIEMIEISGNEINIASLAYMQSSLPQNFLKIRSNNTIEPLKIELLKEENDIHLKDKESLKTELQTLKKQYDELQESYAKLQAKLTKRKDKEFQKRNNEAITVKQLDEIRSKLIKNPSLSHAKSRFNFNLNNNCPPTTITVENNNRN